MRWDCLFCGTEHSTPVREHNYCPGCGRLYVLTVVPVRATLVEPCVRPEPKHGKNRLCRCQECREALLERKREYMRAYRSA